MPLPPGGVGKAWHPVSDAGTDATRPSSRGTDPPPGSPLPRLGAGPGGLCLSTQGSFAQGPRGDRGSHLRGGLFPEGMGGSRVDPALGPRPQSVPGPPWSPVALNTSGFLCTCPAPLPRHWLWCQVLQRRGGGRRPDLLWQIWVLPGATPAGAHLHCGVCGEHGDQRPPAWCGGPTSAHICQVSSLELSVQEWLVDRARPGSSGSSQANTGHGSEADPHSGVRGITRWTGSHLTVLQAEERRVSDSAPDGWMVAKTSPSLAGDWQAGLYVLGAHVHWGLRGWLSRPGLSQPTWTAVGGVARAQPGDRKSVV